MLLRRYRSGSGGALRRGLLALQLRGGRGSGSLDRVLRRSVRRLGCGGGSGSRLRLRGCGSSLERRLHLALWLSMLLAGRLDSRA